ncbi:putative reverse transcriptase domain-containing protein [Tanacetum coccineum]
MEIRQFLGLVGYYRRFIKGFSKIAKSMTKLTHKKVKFDWGDKQEAAFQLLKEKLCSVPILALPEGSEDFVVYYDALIGVGCGANAKGKSDCLCITTAKNPLEELHHPRHGIRSSSVCSKTLEALSVWHQVYSVH